MNINETLAAEFNLKLWQIDNTVALIDDSNTIPFIAIFLSAADLVYFWALSQPGAMISIISMIRRSSVLVSFLGGVFIFRENNIRAKAFDLLLILAGLIFLYIGSK